MYLYLDESGTDGRSEFIFVGGVYSEYKIKSNLINKIIRKNFKKSPKIDEYKFSNKVFDKKLKTKVIKNIKDEFKIVSFNHKANFKNTKEILCKLIAKNLEKVSKENPNAKISIIYDKISEKITKTDIEKYLTYQNKMSLELKIDFVFTMQDSKLEKGIQMADWVVGADRSRMLNIN